MGDRDLATCAGKAGFECVSDCEISAWLQIGPGGDKECTITLGDLFKYLG